MEVDGEEKEREVEYETKIRGRNVWGAPKDPKSTSMED